MAEWKNPYKEKIDPAFAAIRSLFLDGTIDAMYKLIDHNPTKLARLFSMSYRTFHDKLKEPWRFSTLHILLLAKLINIDPEVINRIIQKESEEELKSKIAAFKVKEQKLKEDALKAKKNK